MPKVQAGEVQILVILLEVDLLTEVDITAREEGEVIRMSTINIDKMINSKVTKDRMVLEDVQEDGEVDHPKDGPPEETIIEIIMHMTNHRVWDILVTKVSHNTDMFAVCVQTAVIMIINVITHNK